MNNFTQSSDKNAQENHLYSPIPTMEITVATTNIVSPIPKVFLNQESWKLKKKKELSLLEIHPLKRTVS